MLTEKKYRSQGCLLSFAVFAVIIARLLLNKAPKIFSYTLWSVVLFRLVCPFTLESALSIMPSNHNPIPVNIVNTQSPAINSTNNIISNSVNRTIEATLIPVDTPEVINPMEFVIETGTVIWILGVIALVAYGIIKDYKVSYTYVDNNNKKHELADYYKLSIVNNKINEAKLDESKSSVVK
ncbi:hypothetical protein HZF24_14195 [Sedimentibacter hydroxybenzoicus DSM 7310]|uniref:Peptidase M56 domain-containing protein n=1 Tax=Sedimentibacter hydroxybenzoicus DSM 7310 TaxID=1123245 RepID=A0A974GX77_SEDHY|nr:M56 family metallopeptidase [Sedimentibacter hydroxybenzoicus]NYB75294.1 hypothetical protein [Sedimentibacter hydroxybenzoicus DSM 7310]